MLELLHVEERDLHLGFLTKNNIRKENENENENENEKENDNKKENERKGMSKPMLHSASVLSGSVRKSSSVSKLITRWLGWKKARRRKEIRI